MESVIYLQTGTLDSQIAARNRLKIKCLGLLEYSVFDFILIEQHQNNIAKIVRVDSKSLNRNVVVQDSVYDMTMYENRLNTFIDWKLNFITPTQMANAGLYYFGRDHLVGCAFCSIEFDKWTEGQDPLVEHKRASPDCQFFKESYRDVCDIAMEYNISIYQEENGRANKAQAFLFSVGVQHRNIIEVQNKMFSSFDTRMKTFENCKITLKQDIKSLCKAGFYYIGSGKNDTVICFCCDQKLMDWGKNVNPWIEHARWSPHCSFLLLTKGNNFVRKVIEDNKRVLNNYRLVKGLPDISRSDQAFGYDNIFNETLSLTEGENDYAEITDCEELKIPNITPQIELSLPLPDSDIYPDSLLCKICFKEKMEVVFIPCGHIISCIQCAVTLDDCALCRQPFNMTVTVFIYTNNMSVNNSNQLPCITLPISVGSASATVCKICRKEDMCVAYMPCRHIIGCFVCSLKETKCPVCFEPYYGILQVYL